jgi:hypothetical protein
MKWHKIPYNEKANTHRAGWKFWDLLDSSGETLCMVRYIPDSSIGHDYQLFPMNMDDPDLHLMMFDTLKDAKGAAVAYYVNKRLEEAA